MAEMKLKLQPFTVPNFVSAEMPPGLRQEGFKEAPKWALRDLDAETIVELCDEFRRAVFLKAERPDPGMAVNAGATTSDPGVTESAQNSSSSSSLRSHP